MTSVFTPARLAVRWDSSERHVRNLISGASCAASILARWGLVPWWAREIPKVPHINARAETVYEKALFREAFGKRRALIPASAFFEWQKRTDGKQPYRFQMSDLEPYAFAGLWEFARIADKEILSATIIVGSPNPLAAAVHDRMPVILQPEDYDRWLNVATPVDELQALLRPYPAEKMQATAVSRLVNSVKNDTEACIQPIGEPPLALE